MNYYTIRDEQNKIVLINQTLLATSMNIIAKVNPFVNTELKYEGRTFSSNAVDETPFKLLFYAERQFSQRDSDDIEIDYQQIADNHSVNQQQSPKEIDAMAMELLDNNDLTNTMPVIISPQLMRISKDDLTIRMITKSGNVMASVGNSETLLVSKSLFNKLCQNLMWCAIDEMFVGERNVSVLKGLVF